MVSNIPFHVQTAFREYLKCGIPAHGFARVYCAGCGHDFLVPFSCKGRDVCPSCATRRMVEKAWVCHNPECGFSIRIDNGEISLGKGLRESVK